MAFASPLWLIGLIPWALVALWMLLGRRARTEVPFLPLWEGAPKPPAKKGFEIPPVAVAMMLFAALLGIIAAAGPVIREESLGAVTIIVDRGLTMSVRTKDGKWRYVSAAEAVSEAIGNADIRLRILPPAAISGGAWLEQVRGLGPTAVCDPEAIRQAAQDAVRTTNGPVLVLSDQDLIFRDNRIVQISPERPVNNVGIRRFSLATHPHAQAMVRIYNQSSLKTTRATIRAGDAVVMQEIQLPEMWEARDYFFDLPADAPILEADIDGPDEGILNHQAWLVRSGARPKVEARAALPAEVSRMIEVWSKRRPPDEGGRVIGVVNSSAAMPSDGEAVIVADETVTGEPLSADDHAVIAQGDLDLSNVDWSGIGDALTVALPAGDWTPIVLWGKKPIVAVRRLPSRQVWIGFRSARFASTVDFVLLWNDVLEWLGSGEAIYESEPVGQLGGTWRLVAPTGAHVAPGDEGLLPGVYRTSEGSLKAVNAPDFPGTYTPASTVMDKLRSGDAWPRVAGSAVTLAALGMVCLTAATSKPRN